VAGLQPLRLSDLARIRAATPICTSPVNAEDRRDGCGDWV